MRCKVDEVRNKVLEVKATIVVFLWSENNPELDSDLHPCPGKCPLSVMMRVCDKSSMVHQPPSFQRKILRMDLGRYRDVVCRLIPSMNQSMVEVSV